MVYQKWSMDVCIVLTQGNRRTRSIFAQAAPAKTVIFDFTGITLRTSLENNLELRLSYEKQLQCKSSAITQYLTKQNWHPKHLGCWFGKLLLHNLKSVYISLVSCNGHLIAEIRKKLCHLLYKAIF